jgi:hypothetical protein
MNPEQATIHYKLSNLRTMYSTRMLLGNFLPASARLTLGSSTT